MSLTTIEDQILADYVRYKAAHTGQDPAEIVPQIDRDEFYERIYTLHGQFMAGEFSLGSMAKLLDITKPDLYHLLDAMQLKVTNI